MLERRIACGPSAIGSGGTGSRPVWPSPCGLVDTPTEEQAHRSRHAESRGGVRLLCYRQPPDDWRPSQLAAWACANIRVVTGTIPEQPDPSMLRPQARPAAVSAAGRRGITNAQRHRRSWLRFRHSCSDRMDQARFLVLTFSCGWSSPCSSSAVVFRVVSDQTRGAGFTGPRDPQGSFEDP